MAFDPYAVLQAGQDQEDRIERRRSEKAKAFRDYVDAKTSNGETVDPYELDRVRMSMAGSDPYLASYIPAGEALKELANRANEKSKLTKLQLNAQGAQQRDVERTYVQKIIDDNWDKSSADMAEIFNGAFGTQDGARIYDQYKPELDSMISEATGKKYATLASNPASKLIREESDLYRYFPAEMRNPRTAAILKTMAEDNKRGRTQENAGIALDMLGKTPDFVKTDPMMQRWWADMTAQRQGYYSSAASPDGGLFVSQGLGGMSRQFSNEAQAKIVELGSKDPFFATAAQTGDEDSIFAAIRSLMVQAGLPAPESKNDPSYLQARQSLDMVSRTSAIASYNKRESDLKASAAQEAEELRKNASKRLQAIQDANFPVATYGNGKSGKDAAIDERITMALNLINTDSSFFPSEENLQAAANFIKQQYASDKEKFDPAAAAGRFMAEGGADNQATWIDRRANNILESEFQIKPGTNFSVWETQRSDTLRNIMSEAFNSLNQPVKDEKEYNAVLQNKAALVQGLRAEISKMRQVVNTINNDPVQRGNIVQYNYSNAVSTLNQLENTLKNIEQFNPVRPAAQAPSGQHYGSDGRLYMDGGVNSQVPIGDFYDPASDTRRPAQNPAPLSTPLNQMPRGNVGDFNNLPPTTARTRFDTMLDAIADAESGGDPFAAASTSSARGTFQFTQGTWKSMVDRYGQETGITYDDIWNPNAQRIMASYLSMENARQLMQQTGKMPDERDIYLAHFLGPGRASVVINNQGSSLLAAQLFPDAAKANPTIFYENGVPVTVDQLYKKLGKKMDDRIKGSA